MKKYTVKDVMVLTGMTKRAVQWYLAHFPLVKVDNPHPGRGKAVEFTINEFRQFVLIKALRKAGFVGEGLKKIFDKLWPKISDDVKMIDPDVGFIIYLAKGVELYVDYSLLEGWNAWGEEKL